MLGEESLFDLLFNAFQFCSFKESQDLVRVLPNVCICTSVKHCLQYVLDILKQKLNLLFIKMCDYFLPSTKISLDLCMPKHD